MAQTSDVFDTSASTAAWTDDKDWSLGAPPGEGDDAFTSAYSGTIDYDEVSTIHSWGTEGSTLDIEGGSLTLESATTLAGGGGTNQGTIDVASGATFSLDPGAGFYQLYTLNNSGTVEIGSGATLDVGGTIGGTVEGAGTLELANSTITSSALDMAAIDFAANAVTLDVNLSFDIPFEIATGNDGILLNGNTLSLAGNSIALNGYIDGPGAIDIAGTATIEAGFRDAEGSGNALVTLEVSGALNQTGAWSAAGDLTIDSGGAWDIDDHSNLSDGGNLAIVNNGALDDNATGLSSIINNSFVNNGTISIAAGATLELQAGISGATAQVGRVKGAGALEIDEDATFADNTSIPTLDFVGQTSTLGAGFTAYAGALDFLAQNTVDLSGQTVTLSGGSSQLEHSGQIKGPGTVKITGAATVGGNFFFTGATLEDAGSITQDGQFSLTNYTANGQTYYGELLIDSGANYIFAAANVGLTNGGANDTIVNNGSMEIDDAANSNLDHLVNNGAIIINSLNFQFEGQTNTNDDTIDVVTGSLVTSASLTAGAGKTGQIEIGAGAAATLASVANQVVAFSGRSGTLTLTDPGGFVSDIAGFYNDGCQIVLSGKTIASVTLSGPNASTGLSTLTAKSSTGQTLASLSLQGDFAGLIPIVVNGDAIELTTQHASDFTGSGYSDVAFEDDNGTVATWLVDGAAQDGGAALGAPGPDWTVVATGDLNGDGVADFVFENSATGNLAVWQMANDAIAFGYSISGPGGSWKVVGTGDFNGDGSQGLLLRDDAGNLAIWDVASGGAVTGGEIGNPGAGWTFVGTGDFNGDGMTDLLFENASGQYATWLMDGFKVVGGAALGSPGAGWTYVATGDFAGDGTSDILFQDDSTGEYASWDLKNDAISGGGAIGDPGADWVVKGVGNYGGAAESGVLFENVATGVYADWELDDTLIVGGGAIGAPGPSWSVVGAPPAAAPELPGTVFFQNSAGEVVTWNVEGGVNAGGADFGRVPGYTMLGVGDFTGGLQPDVLFEDGGQYAIWETNGSRVVGGGGLGSPGGTWQFAAIGDFDGSGRDGILFQDSSGDLATWGLDGTSLVDGALIGNPGTGWTFKAAADFTGDGTSDLLLENASGDYEILDVGDNAIVGGGAIGSPGPGWSFMGAGDFNGDGKADILFENTTSGQYATWDMSGTAIVGGGGLGSPGPQWQFAGIADILGDHQDSVLFYDSASNSYAIWNLSDFSIVGGASLGSPGAGWTEKAFV